MKKTTISKIMKRAWELYKSAGCTMRAEFALALKAAWAEAKAAQNAEQPKEYKNVIIASYDSFNFRRYGNPWVALVNDGEYDFSQKIGGYTGRYNAGEAGDLYITRPVEGQVYAYGQKDYRGNKKTNIGFIVFINGQFIDCNKLGRVA